MNGYGSRGKNETKGCLSSVQQRRDSSIRGTKDIVSGRQRDWTWIDEGQRSMGLLLSLSLSLSRHRRRRSSILRL